MSKHITRRYLSIGVLIATISLTPLGISTTANAQEATSYELALHANLPAADPRSPGDPFAVRAGTQILYRIDATVPSLAPDVEYYFETPPGTLFVSAQAQEGARIKTELQPWASGNPKGQGDVRVVVEPRAAFGSVNVTVRVNDVYQGPIDAIARFRGKGPGNAGTGASNRVVFQFDHGDGVPGQLLADAFVDMNGNGIFESDDVRQSCPVYVYRDLAGMRVPDDVAEPTDARLPLASVGHTSFDEPARINLFPGRYSVLLGGCDTPLPPSGVPQTTFDPIDHPAVVRIPNQASTASYEVQTIDITSTRVAEIVRAQQPVGATATPVDVRFDADGALRWTDRADGETGYRVEISGSTRATFELPAGSTRFMFPEGITRCGASNDIQIAVSAVSGGDAGYPARTRSVVAVDCVPIEAPDTGSGPQPRGDQSTAVALMLLSIGAVFACAGVHRVLQSGHVDARGGHRTRS